MSKQEMFENKSYCVACGRYNGTSSLYDFFMLKVTKCEMYLQQFLMQ